MARKTGIEVLKLIGTMFSETKMPVTLSYGKDEIYALPINANGQVFPDTWSAQIFKEKLEKLGYYPVEGSINNMPYIRPQTETEYLSISDLFSQKNTEKQALTILELYGKLAEFSQLAGIPQFADIPLHRDIRKIYKERQ